MCFLWKRRFIEFFFRTSILHNIIIIISFLGKIGRSPASWNKFEQKNYLLQLKRIRIGSSFRKDKYNEWFVLKKRTRLHLSPKKINYWCCYYNSFQICQPWVIFLPKYSYSIIKQIEFLDWNRGRWWMLSSSLQFDEDDLTYLLSKSDFLIEWISSW
jgi:hypothetical protein